jgi:uncharacterized protein YecE (DUF72 family)
LRIGVAGWSLPAQVRQKFADEGSHLERYASVLSAVEINSSFYRDHQAKTFAKWRAMTPGDFRFSVKLHQRFSHEKTFKFGVRDLKKVVEDMEHLEEKFGLLLIQLPASLSFSPKVERLFDFLRRTTSAGFVIEPRNLSWVCPEAIDLYREYRISKVLADPERAKSSKKINFAGCDYYRLHGSPVIYRSSYDQAYLEELHGKLKPQSWCIFDNTTFGHGTENALTLEGMERSSKVPG